jgi:hypothetical protein
MHRISEFFVVEEKDLHISVGISCKFLPMTSYSFTTDKSTKESVVSVGVNNKTSASHPTCNVSPVHHYLKFQQRRGVEVTCQCGSGRGTVK